MLESWSIHKYDMRMPGVEPVTSMGRLYDAATLHAPLMDKMKFENGGKNEKVHSAEEWKAIWKEDLALTIGCVYLASIFQCPPSSVGRAQGP